VRKIPVALVLVLGLGCPSKRERPPAQPQNAQSQRARDSAIAASKLPGAAGVRGALRASDSAAARQAQIDSAGGTP
jgi:hypothetical protein